ncbi:hypothetical protein [Amycolatopsis sp. RTGN1]|uniref:hypothetical protein n=1 Tax=Amycolatopsis ponsaeliensis TaxID=2992142 RepID=UPI00255107F8|nr:hypothetical protein [Amycolatopsis sp. RTGN1]
MTEDELSRRTVSVLSHYLLRRSTEGTAAYDAQLEGLKSLLEARYSDPFRSEVFARFAEHPSDPVEAETMRLNLGRDIAQDPDFAKELASAFASRAVSTVRRPRRRTRVLRPTNSAVSRGRRDRPGAASTDSIAARGACMTVW